MASAYEQLSYDTSQPQSYEQWRDNAQDQYFNSFGKGLTEWWRYFNPNDPYIGKQGYQDYLEKFYADQDTRNSAISEQNQKNFEEYMSSTAYQRAYEDILKTGLNPAILLNSAYGPASTPSSSVAYSRRSTNSTSRNESNSRSFSASAVLAAVLLLLGKML